MTIEKRTLGVQSFTFREFTGKQALADRVKAVGLHTVEACPVHVNAADPDDVKAYLDTMKANGITTSSYGIIWFDCEEEEARRHFEFAKAAGIKVIGASFPDSRIPMLEKLCNEYGIKLAVHNHGRNDPKGTIAALKELFSKCSMNIGLCLDTCWMIDAGDSPDEAARIFKDRLYGLHLKDLVFDKDNAAVDVILGIGLLNLPALKPAIEGAPIEYCSIEYESNPNDPTDDVKKCIENLQRLFI